MGAWCRALGVLGGEVSTGQGSLQADGSMMVREGSTSLILSESWLLFSLDLLMPLRSQYSGGGAVTVSLSAGVAKASLTCSRFSLQEKSRAWEGGLAWYSWER